MKERFRRTAGALNWAYPETAPGPSQEPSGLRGLTKKERLK